MLRTLIVAKRDRARLAETAGIASRFSLPFPMLQPRLPIGEESRPVPPPDPSAALTAAGRHMAVAIFPGLAMIAGAVLLR